MIIEITEMKKVLLFGALMVFGTPAFGQGNGNCEIDGVEEEDWFSTYNLYIKDTDSGQIYSNTTRNINDVITITNDYYVDFHYEPETSRIFSTLKSTFADYEEEEVEVQINSRVTFDCSSSNSELTFKIHIQDTNNHNPEFLPNPDYDIKVFTPLPAKFPISTIFQPIIVKDIDLTTYEIRPEIEENEYFDLKFESVHTDKKQFKLLLETKTPIFARYLPITLKIKAYDVDRTGDDPLFGEGTITIISDPEVEIPTPPEFQYSFYKGHLEDGVAKFENEIRVIEGFNPTVQFALQGENSEYFQIVNKSEVVEIIALTIPDDVLEKNNFFIFSLDAIKPQTTNGSTAIHIYIPKKDPEPKILSFEKNSYAFNYSIDHELTGPNIILSGEYMEDVEYILDEAYVSYFNVNIIENRITLVKKENLTQELLESNVYLTLELTASKIGYQSGITILNIALEKKDVPETQFLEFEKESYVFDYSLDGNLKGDDIKLLGDSEGVDYELDGEHASFFDYVDTGNSIKLIVIGIISQDILDTNIFLTINLRANKLAYRSGITVLNIALPKNESPDKILLAFEKSNYPFIYNLDHELSGPDVMLAGEKIEGVTYNLDGEHASHFTLDTTSDVIKLILKDDKLPQDILDSNVFLTLTLLATKPDYLTGITILNIELSKSGIPESQILEFEKESYSFDYHLDDNLSGDEIKLLGNMEGVDYKLDGEHASFFDYVDTGNSIKLIVKEKLTQDIVDANIFLTLNLRASKAAYRSGVTVLNIALPKKDLTEKIQLAFEKSNYPFIYNLDHELSGPDVMLAGEKIGGVTYNLDGEHASHFTLDTTSDVIKLILKDDKLPQDILDSNVFLTLSILATKPDYLTGITILNIELSKSGIPESQILEFEKESYSFDYHLDDNLSGDEIKLLGNIEGVDYKLDGEHASFFDYEDTGNSIKLIIKEKLTQDIVDANIFLTLNLRASKAAYRSGVTVLNIALPKKDLTEKIQLAFEKSNYPFIYNLDHELSGPDVMLAGEKIGGVTYNLDGEHASHFTLDTTSDVIKLILKDDKLPQDILDSNVFLTLSILATKPDYLTGITILNIELSKSGIPESQILEFEKESYSFDYHLDDNLSGDEIKLLGNIEGVNYKLDGEHASFFDYEDTGNSIKLIIKEKLTQDIVDANIFLTLNLRASKAAYRSGVTVLNIALPKKDLTEKIQLAFEKSNYPFIYNLDHELSGPDVMLAGEKIEGVTYNLDGEYASHFTLDTTTDVIKLKLKDDKLPQDILDSNVYLTLSIFATKPDYLTGITVLNIELPKPGIVGTLLFNKPYFKGLYKNLELEIEEIKVNGYEEGTIFNLNGDYKDYFDADYRDGKVIITGKDLPETILNEGGIILLTLEGRKNLDLLDWTTLIIDVEKKIIPTILFELSKYETTFSNLTLGPIITVKATSNDDSEISYKMNIEDEYLVDLIKINEKSGEIEIVKHINPGNYIFKVNAKSVTAENNTDVLFKVISHDKIEMSLNPLFIVNITEHKTETEIDIGLEINGCEYGIESVWPIEFMNNFTMVNNKLSCENIDRENPLIADMHVSQIQIEIYCGKPPTLFRDWIGPVVRNEYLNNDRNWIYTSNIYSSGSKYVSVIVNDENDHSPVFDEGSKLMIGYPSMELANDLKVPYLVQVHATDKDIDENAEIKFTTDSEYFTIHPNSGIIYPKGRTISEDVSFDVKAIDQNGKGRSSSLVVQVKLLDVNNLIVLNVENTLTENTKEIIEKISDKIGKSLKPLMSAVLPSYNANQYSARVKEIISADTSSEELDSILSIIVYGFDNNEQLVGADVLAMDIEDLDTDDWQVQGVKLSESPLMGKSVTEFTDNVGLIIAVSIISALLLMSIIGMLVWFFVILPKNYTRFDNYSSTGGSRASINSDYDKDSVISSPNEAISRPTNMNQSINTLENIISPEQMTKDIRPGRFMVDDDFETSEAKPAEARKSIRFNETVQQIDIIDYEDEKL